MIIKILKRAGYILLALLFCFAIPVLIKQFVLRPVRFNVIGDNAAGQLFQWGFSLLLILSGYVLFAAVFEKRKAVELSSKKILPGLLKGGLWGILSIGIILLVLGLSGVFRITGLNDSSAMSQMLVMLFLLAATEEILYRGILYRLMEKWTNTVTALAVSSVLFGIMHFSNNYFNVLSLISIISGGAVMGLAYSITKSLWVPIFAHFTWNFSQVLMGLRLSGMDEFDNLALFESELTGNSLLTGGDFGVENSIITIIYTAGFSIILGIRLFRQRKISAEIIS